MRVLDIIRRKRDGEALGRDEIACFVDGVTSGAIPDYQASALLMAIVLRGMDAAETAALTSAMAASGIQIDLSALAGPKLDKHSTGGVGDKTSLVIAPLVACCGGIVPMMSGRGLGHTGGTLDKLEAIPGFRVGLSLAEVREQLGRIGCAIFSQTAEIAPADRILYRLRDATATVENIALITASIMSKKMAEGIDALVLDVKVGRGAFMKTLDEARQLGQWLVDVGREAGIRTEALLTSMDAPLGRAVGNAIEVVEAIETLRGRGPKDLEELSLALAARLVQMGGLAPTAQAAERQVREALDSGAALERFRRMVEAQGGDPRAVDEPRRMKVAEKRHLVTATRAGFVTRLDAEAIGRATVLLGAGRSRAEDPVNPAVGAMMAARPGDAVQPGQPLLMLHYQSEADLPAALALVQAGITIGDDAPATGTQVLEVIGQR